MTRMQVITWFEEKRLDLDNLEEWYYWFEYTTDRYKLIDYRREQLKMAGITFGGRIR
jgi:hypothetical protein